MKIYISMVNDIKPRGRHLIMGYALNNKKMRQTKKKVEKFSAMFLTEKTNCCHLIFSAYSAY